MQTVRQFQLHFKRYSSLVPAWLAPILLAVMIGIGGVTLWKQQGTQVEHEFLWNGRRFTDGELATILKALSKAKLTQFTVVDRQIQVPRGMESRYLTAMADGQALPKDFQSNTDAALSSKSVFEFERERLRQFNHARAKDMAQLISAMDGIDNASVQYDESEVRGLQPTREVTASVAVMTADGHLLDATEVSAIRGLVAGAKIGMKPEQVNVTDLRSSRSWSGPLEQNNESIRPQERLAIQQSVERHWQQKVNRIVQTVPHAQAVVSLTLPSELTADETQREKLLVSAPALNVLVELPKSYLQRLAVAKLAELKVKAQASPSLDHRSGDSAAPLTLASAFDEIQSRVTQRLRASLFAILPPGVDVSTAVTIQVFDDGDMSPELAWLAAWQEVRQKARDHQRILLASLAIFSVGMITARIKRHRRRRRAVPDVATIPLHSYRDIPNWPGKDEAVDPSDLDENDLRGALADLVRQDPDSAARILNRWMERAG